MYKQKKKHKTNNNFKNSKSVYHYVKSFEI